MHPTPITLADAKPHHLLFDMNALGILHQHGVTMSEALADIYWLDPAHVLPLLVAGLAHETPAPITAPGPAPKTALERLERELRPDNPYQARPVDEVRALLDGIPPLYVANQLILALKEAFVDPTPATATRKEAGGDGNNADTDAGPTATAVTSPSAS